MRKTFKPGIASDQWTKNSFENEERILSLLRSLRQPNIVQLLASYIIEKQNAPAEHVLLFTRADYTLSEFLGFMGETPKTVPRHVWTAQFPSEYKVFQGLWGLASALQSLHDYGSSKFQIKLIGCHYDLAPRNILVHNGTFLLADFGLSKFTSDTSKAIFEAGRGDYLAPECRPVEDGVFKKGTVSRPSDIWSFGCVVMEILTYMRGGTDEVREFRTARREAAWGFTASQFHSTGKAKTSVVGHLKKLEVHFGSWRLFKVLREMLEIEPLERPLISTITPNLFMHAQEKLLKPIQSSFDLVVGESSELVMRIERERLKIWASEAGLLHIKRETVSLFAWAVKLLQFDYSESPGDDDDPLRNWLLESPGMFEEVGSLLQLVQSELISIQSLLRDKRAAAWPIYTQLQGYIDRLWILLPTTLAKTATAMLEDKILDTDDQELLRKTSRDLGDDSPYKNIARLATMKYMMGEFSRNESKEQDKNLQWKHPVRSQRIGMHRFGKIPAHKNSSEEKNVLIERISYSASWSQKNLQEVFRRVGVLATMLNATEPLAFRTLRCVKYYHDTAVHAFGLVYDFPKEATKQGLMPVTLKDIILTFQRPELGTLFRLASLITSSVESFHVTTWVHKNISSYNILFFDAHLSLAKAERRSLPRRDVSPHLTPSSQTSPDVNTKAGQKPLLAHKKSGLFSLRSFGKSNKLAPETPGEASPTSTPSSSTTALPPPPGTIAPAETRPLLPTNCKLNAPYLVGLNYTREDSSEALTTGAPEERELRIYQHPEYQNGKVSDRFRLEYDYYSTGLVLLEIGNWDSLENLAPTSFGGNASPVALAEAVSRLAYTMGSLYRDAVAACLYGDFGVSASEDSESKRNGRMFHELVVRRITECRA